MLKNFFGRLRTKNQPSSGERTKSENRHDKNNQSESSSTSLSTSKIVSNGEYSPQKETKDQQGSKQNSARHSRVPSLSLVNSVDRVNGKFPELVSLSSARKRMHTLHNNSARRHDDKPLSDKGKKLLHVESQSLTKIEDLSPVAVKKLHEINKISKYPAVEKFSVSTNVSTIVESCELGKKEMSNNTSVGEERLSRQPLRPRQSSNDPRNNRDKVSAHDGSSSSPRGHHSNPADRILARSEAYMKKNRNDLSKALKNIEFLNNNSQPATTTNTTNSTVNNDSTKNSRPPRGLSGSESSRNKSQPTGKHKYYFPQGQADSQKKGSTKGGRSIDKRRDSTSKLLYSPPINDKAGRIMKTLEDDPVIDSDAWNRYEVKTRGVQQSTSSFDEEMKRVDKWLTRNSVAMTDLVSIRENLLELYLKEDIKTHKNNKKVLKIA